ncbi:hypothetical protein AYO49_03625 [Verrucomicrobiaceae bacterium SCGC AG-212-N21]|nr:hypothetical protein AYO49_03625 [Verrucomicrobiaceae bacterium SCGC AG-212-N21]
MIDPHLAALADQGSQPGLDANSAPAPDPALDPDPAPGFKPDGSRYTDEEVAAIWKSIEDAAARLQALEAETHPNQEEL